MSTEDLWGEIPVEIEIKLPVTILKEQASILGERTNKILEAKVNSLATSDNVTVGYSFNIIAPAVNNYKFTVFHITHPAVFIYPISFRFQAAVGNWAAVDCSDETQFTDKLREVLSSEVVHKAIAALIAQSKAAA